MERLRDMVAWLGAILIAVSLMFGVVSLVGGQSQVILSVVNPPVISTSERPASTIVNLSGQGSMRRAIEVVDGRYGFWWFATAGEADCTFRLVLESPDGPIVLDDYGRIDGGQSAGGMTADRRVTAGSYELVTDTDCPGDASLSAWRYLD